MAGVWSSTDGSEAKRSYAPPMNESSFPVAIPAVPPESTRATTQARASLPRTILVGVDRERGCADALTLARMLAEACGAALTVASVDPVWLDSIPPNEYTRLAAKEEERVKGDAARTLGCRDFQTRVVLGARAPDGLKEIAAAEGADLIVVGPTHRGRVGQVLPGSVGERVLDGAPCAVAIPPPGFAQREQHLRRIVVGCDGSREAEAALEQAAALAERVGSELTLLGVVEMRFDLAGFPRPAAEAEIARIERVLERARAGLPPTLAVETRDVHGVPADMIAAAARGADLLMIGSRGHYGAARRLFLGSVASRVVRIAPCATIVVPAI
jgi:nucleotide-binding universal stress UspA family protein